MELNPRHSANGETVCNLSSYLDTREPFIAVLRDEVAIQPAAESTLNLSVVMALETENGQIRNGIVARILINMMNLNCLAAFVAHAACSVREKHHFSSVVCRDRDSVFRHGGSRQSNITLSRRS